jgi:hypothetical protein
MLVLKMLFDMILRSCQTVMVFNTLTALVVL